MPASFVNKAGTPSESEWNVIKGHPILGEHLVEPLAKFLSDALTATGRHHEKWDGTGYPRGLKGTEIGWAARIVAVADLYAVTRHHDARGPVQHHVISPRVIGLRAARPRPAR